MKHLGSLSKLKERVESKIEYLKQSIRKIMLMHKKQDKQIEDGLIAVDSIWSSRFRTETKIHEMSSIIKILKQVIEKIEEHEDPIDLSTSLEYLDL
jgi:bacillopeptidase F (M6 metalloprotease family)